MLCKKSMKIPKLDAQRMNRISHKSYGNKRSFLLIEFDRFMCFSLSYRVSCDKSEYIFNYHHRGQHTYIYIFTWTFLKHIIMNSYVMLMLNNQNRTCCHNMIHREQITYRFSVIICHM